MVGGRPGGGGRRGRVVVVGVGMIEQVPTWVLCVMAVAIVVIATYALVYL